MHSKPGSVFLVRTAIAAFAVLASCSCSTVKTVDLPPDQLHEQIASGQLVHGGDSVTITTLDGSRHDLQILEVSDDSVRGEETYVPEVAVVDEHTLEQTQVTETRVIEIPVADIVSIESREPTAIGAAGVAAGALAGMVALWYLLLIALPAALIAGAL